MLQNTTLAFVANRGAAGCLFAALSKAAGTMSNGETIVGDLKYTDVALTAEDRCPVLGAGPGCHANYPPVTRFARARSVAAASCI